MGKATKVDLNKERIMEPYASAVSPSQMLSNSYSQYENGAVDDVFVSLPKIRKFVEDKHEGQKRKNGEPYIVHPKSVARLANHTATSLKFNDHSILVAEAAGLLHDVVEDQGCDFEDIERISCKQVAILVAFLSDDKRAPSDWRHQNYCSQLYMAPKLAQCVKISDIHDNASDAIKVIKARMEAKKKSPPSDIRFFVRWRRKAFDMFNMLSKIDSAPIYHDVRVLLMELTSLTTGEGWSETA